MEGRLITDENLTSGNSNSSSSGSTVDGFSGQTGPVFDGWTQCEGYLDQSGGDDIPQAWGDDCTDDSYTKIKLCCGQDTDTYRYIDVNKKQYGLSSTNPIQ